MCKTTDNIQKTAEYFEKIFGERIEITPLSSKCKNSLPLAIREGYGLFKTFIFNEEVCLLFSLNNNEFTPGQLQKQKQMLTKIMGMPIVFVFEKMHSYNLQRIIAQRVNFIVIGKQIYLHDFLINLNKPKSSRVEAVESPIPPIAQCIVLYHIEKNSLQDKTIEEVSQIFSCSYPTAARAVRWLADNDLVKLPNEKTKRLIFPDNNKVLWEKATDLLRTPVERVVYTDEVINNACLSGINALSAYSMLNDENKRYYAVHKSQFKDLKVDTDKIYGENLIEIWRYDPNILSEKGKVDRLSLYLSMRENADERIQIELENMLNDIKW